MVMAERKKNKKRKELGDHRQYDDKPSKEEYEVAQYLKKKLPEKKTTLQGHKVEYFIACRAVDCLMESHWALESKKGKLCFSNRDAAVIFMEKLLAHKFFHRARKIVIQKECKKKKKEDSDKESLKKKPDAEKNIEKEKQEEEVSASPGKKKKKKDELVKKKDEKALVLEESGKDIKKKKSAEGTKDGKKEVTEVKKKIKLDMHLEQIFVDSNEPYVWLYDPIPLRTWITGTLMVVAAVLLCLFPLWPMTIRHYIYHLSVAAAFFLVFIIGLAVLRLVVFVLVWLVTFGKHHVWLLPNLTEDVGFFESFWPLYKYEYKGYVKEDKTPAEEDDAKEEEEEEEDPQESTEEGHKSEEQDSEDQDTPENGFEFLDVDEAEEDRKTK